MNREVLEDRIAYLLSNGWHPDESKNHDKARFFFFIDPFNGGLRETQGAYTSQALRDKKRLKVKTCEQCPAKTLVRDEDPNLCVQCQGIARGKVTKGRPLRHHMTVNLTDDLLERIKAIKTGDGKLASFIRSLITIGLEKKERTHND